MLKCIVLNPHVTQGGCHEYRITKQKHARDIHHCSCHTLLAFFFFFFFFQRLRLLRGTALIVTRVNLHVDFTLCVWICRSWHLIILNIVKGNAMFNTRLNPMRPEAVGEKQNRPFILSNIWMKIIHTAQTVTTIALGRVFAMQLMYLQGIANSKEPKQTG